jgi:60 kDa SS-A/Ro ribonucleoprotein
MKFNKKEKPTVVQNLAGGEAYGESPELELITILLTSFVEDKFYETAASQMARLSGLIANGSPEFQQFAARAAVYARREFGMRSISHVVAVEIGKVVKGVRWTREFFDRVVYRPDDVTEILAHFMGKYGKPIPNAMKKGMGTALSRFDEYQVAKYKASGATVSLVDAVNLLHPQHTPALAALVNGSLASPETWEVRLTRAGKSDDVEVAKADAWADLIRTRKLGYFALLRNIRNIADQAPDVLNAALEMLVDEKQIKKALVMPFRFLVAAAQFNDHPQSRQIKSAISAAIDIAVNNVPRLPGRTLVALDHSGSMTSMGDKSYSPMDIGLLFAAALYKSNDADLILFSNDARYATPDPNGTVSSISREILAGIAYGGTNFRAIMPAANQAYDRVIILSDMQGWMGYNSPADTLAGYEQRFNCHPYIYSLDLAGYGSLQFPQERVLALAGFSDKIFDIMAVLEQDKAALFAQINEVAL